MATTPTLLEPVTVTGQPIDIETDDIVQDILNAATVNNPEIRFAHDMLNAAGFNGNGIPLDEGPQNLPEAASFTGVGIPAAGKDPFAADEDEEPEEAQRTLLERAGRVGVMVLRAPFDVAGSTIDQLDRLRALASAKIGETLASAFGAEAGQQMQLALGAEITEPQDIGGTIERITNKVLAQPETGLERGVNDVARFLVAFVPGMKALKAAGMASRVAQASAAGGATEFFALDPDAPFFAEAFSGLSPEMQDFVRTYLKDPANDIQAEENFREALRASGTRALFDGVLFGALLESLIVTMGLVRQGLKSKNLFVTGQAEFIIASREAAEGVLPRSVAPDILGVRVQRVIQSGAPRVPVRRQLPVRATQETIPLTPGPARAPIQPTTQRALPAGQTVLRLKEGITPEKVVDDIFETLQVGIGRSSQADVVAAIEVVAKQSGRDPKEIANFLRIGEALVRGGGGGSPVPISRLDFFRRVLGPDDAKDLALLAGIIGTGGAALTLGMPTDEKELTTVMTEAGIGTSLARFLARRFGTLARSLDEAAASGSVAAPAAARGVRPTVGSGAIVTDVIEKGVPEVSEEVLEGQAREAAEELLFLKPTRIDVRGVRKDINFAKIDQDQEVQDLLGFISDVDEAAITEGRRLGTSMQAEAQLARTMGMTVEDLHAFAQKASILPKVAVAANEILVASATRLEELRKAVMSGAGSLIEDEYLKQYMIHGKIQRSVGTIRAESGRTLGMYRIDRSGNIELLHSLTEQAKRAGKKTGVTARQLAEASGTLTPVQQAKFAREMTRPTASGALLELWMNNILSGPKTAGANLTGSVVGLMMAPTERAISTRYNQFLHGDMAVGEASLMLYSYIANIGDALSLARKTFRTGEPGFTGSRAEMMRQPQITAEAFNLDPSTTAGAMINGLGTLIRTPGRILMATDDAAKLLLYRAELRAQGLRSARAQNIGVGDLDRFLDDFMATPPEQAINAATKSQEVYTFTNALSDKSAGFQRLRAVGAAVQGLTSQHPIFKLIVPFVRTPVDLATVSGERTPILNLLSSTFRSQLASGNLEVRAEALTKLTMSAGVLGFAALLSSQGLLTGTGPNNKQMIARFREQGVQMSSIRIGDKWVGIDRLDPIGGPLIVAADLASVMGMAKVAGIPDREINSVVSAAVLSFANLFVNKTYMRGLATLMDAVRGGTFGQKNLDSAERIGLNILTGGLVPNLVQEFRRTIDRTRREVDSAIDTLKNKIPGLSSTLPAMTNAWGDEVLYGHGVGPGILKDFWNFLAPFNVTKVQQHKSSEMLADNQIAYSGPGKIMQGVELTPVEHNFLKKRQGDILRPQWERFADQPVFQRLTPGPEGGRARLFRRLAAGASRRARFELLRNPNFTARQRIQEHQRKGLLVQPAAASQGIRVR